MAPGFEPDQMARKIAVHLAKKSIEFQVAENGRLHIALPNGFGTLEIGALDEKVGDTICGLIGHPWHTHGDQFGVSGIDDQCAALARFVTEIFDGRYLMIEEISPDQEPRRILEESLEQYLRYLPEGTTYKVFSHE